MNRVYQVYNKLGQAGQDILLPAPPLDPMGAREDADHNPNQFRHGVIDRPAPHKVSDRAKLLAQVEMDAQIDEIRRQQINANKQRVLPKPNLNVAAAGDSNKASSSEAVPPAAPMDADHNGNPVIQGGEDGDPEAKRRRDHVKGVSKSVCSR